MGIQKYLRDRQVPFQCLLHPPSPSATRFARSVHVPGKHVAKGVLLRADDSFVLAVLPATHRVDLPRLAALLGVSELGLATEDEVAAIFRDCERGALPPLGRPYGLQTVVDASLACGEEIVIEGNARHEGLRLRYRDYEAIESPRKARFATAIAPRIPRTSRRRAG